MYLVIILKYNNPARLLMSKLKRITPKELQELKRFQDEEKPYIKRTHEYWDKLCKKYDIMYQEGINLETGAYGSMEEIIMDKRVC